MEAIQIKLVHNSLSLLQLNNNWDLSLQAWNYITGKTGTSQQNYK